MNDEFTELYERSKDDHASRMIVGSEVRVVIGAVRDARAKITELEKAIKVLAAIVLKEHNDSSKFVFAAEPSALANPIAADAIKESEKDR